MSPYGLVNPYAAGVAGTGLVSLAGAGLIPAVAPATAVANVGVDGRLYASPVASHSVGVDGRLYASPVVSQVSLACL